MYIGLVSVRPELHADDSYPLRFADMVAQPLAYQHLRE